MLHPNVLGAITGTVPDGLSCVRRERHEVARRAVAMVNIYSRSERCVLAFVGDRRQNKNKGKASMRRIVLGVASVAALALAARGILFRTMQSVRRSIIEWQQKRKLRRMLRRIGSIRHLEKGISADRPTTERLLLAVGAKKSGNDEWTLYGHQW